MKVSYVMSQAISCSCNGVRSAREIEQRDAVRDIRCRAINKARMENSRQAWKAEMLKIAADLMQSSNEDVEEDSD